MVELTADQKRRYAEVANRAEERRAERKAKDAVRPQSQGNQKTKKSFSGFFSALFSA
ncbi:hypothetical protein [Parasalinivibrio latis]|uniref:hypothetical protein n=1 Tax=Parasalinivibrio latis TaxID=2952610 RepID=UPI003DA54DFE